MIRNIYIFLTVLTLMGCNISGKDLIISHKNLNDEFESSTSAKYLIANYSLKKGDVYTASQIDRNTQNPKLLEFKFFSNLISGNFEKQIKYLQY